MIPEIALFALLAVATFVIGYFVVRMQRDPIRDRLAASIVDDGYSPKTGKGEHWADMLAEQLPVFNSENGKLDRELRRAGYYTASSRRDYFAMRNALVIGVIVLTGLVALTIGPERQAVVLRALGIGFSIAGFCWAGPRILLRMKGDRRVEQIRRGLPHGLDMITMCIAGGLSLQDAVQRISREMYLSHPHLSVELFIVSRHASISSLELAFRNFAQRIDAPEIVSLAALIRQGQHLGADMGQTIRDFADEMRQTRRQFADEHSNKAAVKLLFPITLCLLPAACIILWGPAALEFWSFLQDFGGDAGP